MTVAEVKDKMQRAPGEVVLVDCRNPEEQEVRRACLDTAVPALKSASGIVCVMRKGAHHVLTFGRLSQWRPAHGSPLCCYREIGQSGRQLLP